MGPIRTLALGSESPLSQISRIREGLVAQPGVVLVEDPAKADVVYANDAGYHAAALAARDAGYGRPKVILGVLDIPLQLLPPNGDYTVAKLGQLRQDLLRADAVTTISPYTQAQLAGCLGIGSTVVWNPIKPVSPAQRLAGYRPYSQFRALIMGRARDRNKRIDTIGIPALVMAGFEETEVAVIGGEYPGWGTNLGIVPDEVLNDLLNSVDYLMQPTCLTGLELPIAEAIICGAIPLVCHDLTTFSDLSLPRAWGCYPSAASVAYRLRLLEDNPSVKEADRRYCLAMGGELASELSKEKVARRILGVYRGLVSTSSTP